MSQAQRPPVWRMVKEAVEHLGGATTNVAVRDWILGRYPDTRTNTIACQVIVCTVNHASRIHYSENQKQRSATGPQDFLFRPAKGELVWYDPTKHGEWEIAETDDGSLIVRGAGQEVPQPVMATAAPGEGSTFAAEHHLRDYLVKNLSVIEEGLELFSEADRDGVEFNTEMGRIDILAVDKEGGLLVVELKVERGPDQVCGQILRYLGWVKRHLAKGRPVRGLIIAKHISDRIRYALADVPNVTVREYELNIRLHPVAHVDAQPRRTAEG